MKSSTNSAKKAFTKRIFKSQFRNNLNTMLFDVNSKAGKRSNLFITLLIIVSVLISMAATLKDINPSIFHSIQLFEMWVTILFSLEFLARCYAAKSMKSYVFSFYGITDMLAILPMLLVGDPNLAIRLLRIVRLLKLVRYLRVMRLFLSSMQDTLEMLAMVFGSIALGAVLAGNIIYTLEPETFSSAFEGAWWGIVTMTTVGYGDVVPHTLAGRTIAVLLMVVGICMFAVVTAVVSVKITRSLHHGVKCKSCEAAIAPEFPYCPYCSHKQQDKPQ